MLDPQYLEYMRVKRAVVLAILAIAVMLSASSSQAIGLSGQLTSDFYITDENGLSHIRPYERLQANLLAWQGTGGRSLAFHSYLRWTGDWADRKLVDPETYVYDAYLKLIGVPKGTALFLGRQFVYNGVGSALLDGLRLKYRIDRRFQVDLFGGSGVSQLHPDKVQSPADFAVLGGRLSSQPNSSIRLGLNWMLRRSEGFTVSHRVGLDGDITVKHLQLYSRVAYDVASLSPAALLLRTSYSLSRWYWSGEFDWREPSVSSNSIFSLIDARRYREARAEVQRTVWRRLAVVGQLQVGFFTADRSWRTGIGVRSDNFSVGWRHQTGYGGDHDGLYGFANLPLTKHWECFATADAGRYRVQEEQDGRSDAYAGGLGLLWRSGHGLAARVDGQYLRNAVQSRDLRINLRVSQDFSLGERAGNGI